MLNLPPQTPPASRGRATVEPGKGVAPSLSACLQATYNNGQVCANFPQPIGQQCVTIPQLPSGSGSAQACISSSFPYSTAQICVTVAGNQLPCVTVSLP